MVDPNVWDQHRIKAEVHRRGSTLTEVALKAGLSESACRVALKGASRAGAEALARFLGQPISVLFPGWYMRPRSTGAKPTAKPGSVSRQKRNPNIDERRVRA